MPRRRSHGFHKQLLGYNRALVGRFVRRFLSRKPSLLCLRDDSCGRFYSLFFLVRTSQFSFDQNTDLLSKLNGEEYQKVTKLIKWLIISTDLANYFRQRGSIAQSIKNGTFDWNNPKDRLPFMGMIMTCCDISGQCKPFRIASKVTEGLYKEFYRQVRRTVKFYTERFSFCAFFRATPKKNWDYALWVWWTEIKWALYRKIKCNFWR